MPLKATEDMQKPLGQHSSHGKYTKVSINRVFRSFEKYVPCLNGKKKCINIKCLISRITCTVPENMIEVKVLSLS